nr:glycosyltransferase family 61 protein [uncultured Aquabacterium sp.]
MKSLNLPRLRRLVSRAVVGRSLTIEDVAERTWTVCPESRGTCAPALHPAGTLERIQGLSPYRNWPAEQALIQGGEVTLPLTVGHLLRNAHVVDSHVYSGACEWLGGVGGSPLWLSPAPREPDLARATMTSTGTGSLYFGCLLLDDFPLELLGSDPADNIAMLSKPSGHEAGYRELLGLRPRRVVRRAAVRELTFFVDPAYNPSKADRYRRLRAALRSHVSESSGTGLVYIRRGMSGQRRVMANEAELEAVLAGQGFTVIDPMKTSALDVARMSLDARLVVSIEGSQISHAQFSMADDAALIVLQPPDRFCMQYKEFTDSLGMRFGFVVCQPGDEGFKVDIPELLGLIDRMKP